MYVIGLTRFLIGWRKKHHIVFVVHWLLMAGFCRFLNHLRVYKGASGILSLNHQDIWTMSQSKEIQEKLEIVYDEKELQHNIIDNNSLEDDSKPVLHNGEPVITAGRDVSRFVVDIRDDNDTALTFRSMFLGTIIAGMGATLSQVSHLIFLDYDSNNAIRFKL